MTELRFALIGWSIAISTFYLLMISLVIQTHDSVDSDKTMRKVEACLIILGVSILIFKRMASAL